MSIYKQTKTRSLLHAASYFSTPAVVFAAIWFSVISHYYVPSPVITHDVAEQGRQAPPDALLDELSGFYFFEAVRHDQTVEAAEKILRGNFALPGEAARAIHLPFDPQDISEGSLSWQLFHARLVIPRLLLAAYRMTGREEFFLMARDVILGWTSYERRAVLPKGLLWNDHAIAERVLALADFWALYRHHPSYESDTAKAIFVFAARSGQFLADPSRFTVSTNHGVMQNLALWHLSLAFPSIPESKRYQQLAFERLGEQLTFYVNDEGFVLEHSAGYQKTGVQFMSMAFRYMSLQGIPVPDEWRQKYEKAKGVYAELRRPDGSLPMIGDTSDGVDRDGPLVTTPDHDGWYGPLKHRVDWSTLRPYGLYPVAGYSIWWEGSSRWPSFHDLSQTFVAWSHFPGQAHKHADEMSVLLWAKGETWWTNVGYWSYGTPGRGEAESWNGSNAPHLEGEDAASRRTTRLLGIGRVDGLSFIDLERRGPRDYVARRQVVHATNGFWVVIDHTSGDVKDRTETTWTTAHDVQLSDGRIPGSYVLKGKSNESVLTAFFLSSEGTKVRRYRGSYEPFAGWQVVDDISKPASAIMLQQPANDSWAVTVWSLNGDRSAASKITAAPSIHSWSGAENWMIMLPTESARIELLRQGNNVLFRNNGARPTTSLKLTRPAGVDLKNREIQAAHDEASRKYPRFRDEMEYRLKLTYLSVALLVLQEVFFAIYKRVTHRHYMVLRGLSTIAWLVLGLWLTVIRVRLI